MAEQIRILLKSDCPVKKQVVIVAKANDLGVLAIWSCLHADHIHLMGKHDSRNGRMDATRFFHSTHPEVVKSFREQLAVTEQRGYRVVWQGEANYG